MVCDHTMMLPVQMIIKEGNPSFMGSSDPIKISTIGCHVMREKRIPSLMDILAESAGCPFLSDLYNLKPENRIKLVQRLETISAGDYPLPVWNDALDYLISAPSQASPDAARERLIDHYLSQEETLCHSLPKEE